MIRVNLFACRGVNVAHTVFVRGCFQIFLLPFHHRLPILLVLYNLVLLYFGTWDNFPCVSTVLSICHDSLQKMYDLRIWGKVGCSLWSFLLELFSSKNWNLEAGAIFFFFVPHQPSVSNVDWCLSQARSSELLFQLEQQLQLQVRWALLLLRLKISLKFFWTQ